MSSLTIVMYHYVRDLEKSRYPHIKGLDYKMFKQQVEFFKNNYKVVTMEEVIASFDEGYELPKKSLLLTFDDGYIDNFTYVFPVLKEYKMQGSFFIPGKSIVENTLLDVNKAHFILASSNVNAILNDLYEQLNYFRGEEYEIEENEVLFNKYAQANRFDTKEVIFIKRLLQTVLPEDLRNKISSNIFEKRVGVSEDVFARELYMNYDQIKCMKSNNMYIGIHGYGHNWLGNVSDREIQNDIDKALYYMDGAVNVNSWVMNYPYGSYNQNVVKYIQSKGCKLGLTTEVRVANIENDNRYMLPRLDTNDFPPKSNKYLEFQLF